MNDVITTYMPSMLFIVGILAFIVSVIVEVTKNLELLRKIPTDLWVITLSVVLSLLTLFAYTAIAAKTMAWYMVVGAIILGFFVSFVSMYGWATFVELYDRFKK